MPFPKAAHRHSPVIKPSCKDKLLSLLTLRAWAADDLAKEVHRMPKRVSAILRELHKTHQVHISSWRKAKNGHYIPVWESGSKADAPNPSVGQAPLKVNRPSKSERHKDAYILSRSFVTSERVWGI